MKQRITRRSFVRTTGIAAGLSPLALKKSLAAHLPKNPAKPVPGSKSRLVEMKDDGFVDWENQCIEKGAKIPAYE